MSQTKGFIVRANSKMIAWTCAEITPEERRFIKFFVPWLTTQHVLTQGTSLRYQIGELSVTIGVLPLLQTSKERHLQRNLSKVVPNTEGRTISGFYLAKKVGKHMILTIDEHR